MEADANEAEAALADPDTAFGLFSATVIVSDPDAAKARDKAHDILGVFNGAGIPARLETFGAVDAWFGTIPGDVRNGVTRPPITTTNFADLCPTTTPWKGETKRVLAEVRTTTGEAFNLSLHAGGSDVGHTAIIGPTGAGKSVLLSFIAAMKLREENARVIMVDHGGSARGVTEALGGTWHHLTEGSASFQPLRYADDMAALWLEDALSWSRVEVTQEVSEDVRRVIGLLAEEAPDDRRLDLARRLLARASWREALKALPAWFNGVERDRDNMLPIEAYELGGLMEHRAGSLVIEHMARMIERNLDGRPTLICFDEAWLALAGTALGRALEVWLRTLRKRNAAVIFATQAVADLTRSDLASVVLEQVPTRIFLPNVAASEPATRAAYESLGVNPATIRVIARSTPKQDYILQSPSSTAAVVLDLGPVGLELCTKQSARNSGVLCNAAA